MLLNGLKKTLSFVWHLHRKLLISLIITLAVVLLTINSVAFYLEKNPKIVAELIETHFNTKVIFEEIKVGVHFFFPSVAMNDFTILSKLDDESLLEFSSAKIVLNIPLSIFSGHLVIDTLELKGFNAIIHRDINNQISIADFQLTKTKTQAQNNKSDPGEKLQYFFSFLNQTNFMISESEIYFVDEMKEIPELLVSGIDLKMKNDNDRHQISLLARLNESATYLDFRLDFNGDIHDVSNWDGQVYASVDNLNHQALLHLLQKDFIQVEEFQLNDIEASTKIWSTIIKGNLQSVHGELNVENANLNRVDNNKNIHFDALSTNFKLERSHITHQDDASKVATLWLMDLYDFNLSVDSKLISEKFISFKLQEIENSPLSQIQIYLDNLDIDEFSNVVSFFSPKKFNETIYSHLKPRGSLNNIFTSFQFDWSEMPIDIRSYQIQLDIDDFGMNAVQVLPKIRHFSAQVIFNETMGRVLVDSREMKLYLKALFRDAWLFNSLTGELFWQKEGDEWLLGAERVTIKSPHFSSANVDLNVWLSENAPVFMDLKAFYSNVNVKEIHNYVPAKVMNEGLVEWLDYSLISGLVPDGGIVFRGNLSDFPYTQHDGNLDIVFNTENVLLEYLKGWPKLSNISSQVQFTQKGMKVESRHSKLFSAQSQNVVVDLDDYLERKLLIKGDIKSTLDDGLKFLNDSHLVSKNVLDMINAKGAIDINLDLAIPLEKGNGKISGQPDIKSRIKLMDVDYYPPGFEKKKGLVSHLNGNIVLHNQSVNAKKLSAKIMGMPAKIVITSSKLSSKSKRDPDINVKINSEVSIRNLKKYKLIDETLKPLMDHLSGKSHVKLNIKLPNNQRAFSFNIKSNLKNIESKLPGPFNKEAKKISPLVVSYAEKTSSDTRRKKSKSALLNVKFSNVFSLVFMFDASSNEKGLELLKGNIAFKGDQARLPKNNVLRVTGALKQVPIAQWQSVFEPSLKNNSSQSPVSKKFSVPIEISMTELILPALKFKTNPEKKSASSSTIRKKSDFKPQSFPLLNGTIDSVKLGKIELGRFEIQSSRIKKGIVFDAIVLENALFYFNGKGNWSHLNGHSQVHLGGNVKIPSIEKMAVAFGNDHLFRRGKSEVSGYISWPGGLNDISYETIEGKINIQVGKGAWIEGEPGPAGRLLGLLNMNAFARRLSLDFSDVSKDGFEFDRIEGDFRFENAMAYTDNFKIYSPSAKILLRGSTGLVSEEFDQRVTVIPEVSATLPLAGAVVAGPAGAAVVWVGQKILGDQLNQVTAYDYTIKGTWEQPVIKKDVTSKTTLENLKNLFKLQDDKTVSPDVNPVFNTD